jgi:outer membrane lipopolysaccharide assembly protein LptE/RlpB
MTSVMPKLPQMRPALAAAVLFFEFSHGLFQRALPLRRSSQKRFATLGIALVLTTMLLTSCGYHVVGRNSSLPSGWKTIAVPAFTNRTTHYRIEQVFTAAVIREFLARTSYKIVQNEQAADGILHGEVLTIETSPILFDATTGQVTTMLVTVHAKISLVTRADEKVVFNNDDLVFREEYQISGDAKNFFEEQNPALSRMSREFAARVVGDVVEGF